MYVIKRNGCKEEIDIAKIQKQTIEAVSGLDNVSQSELEVDAQILFKDGIRTEDIQSTLIKTAADKIDVDAPNWTYVAARLFLYDLYHKVSKKHGYLSLREYIDRAQGLGIMLKGYTDVFDLDYLDSKIDTKRDLQFTYLGIKTLYDRYLLKDSLGNPIELPQHMFMAIAMFLSHQEKDPNYWALKFYDLLSKFEVMCATPTLSNARTTRHQLSSCYVGSMPDNIEGIFDSYKEMALLSKYGGGIGYDVSRIRSTGSTIDGNTKAAGGVIPFMKMCNDVAVAVDQLGTRKGAIAVYLEVWHMDILDFIDLRKNSGDERRRTHDLFPAVWICDLFMKRVADNENWSLFDPYECSELTDLYGYKFEEKYIELENNPVIRRDTINAKELWKKILTNYFEAGMPFLCFKDNANRANPNKHVGIIRSSNLCTEIFQNTSPSFYQVKVTFNNGEVDFYYQDTIIELDNGKSKKANKLTSLDSICGQKVKYVERIGIEGETAVCNLASVNIGKINSKEDLERVVPIAIRMLDNVIDLNLYPTPKVMDTNLNNRAIGLGIMGESEMLATKQIMWGSDKHLKTIDTIMEIISYNAIKSSSLLGKEKGNYRDFKGSDWNKGIMPIDKSPSSTMELVKRNYVYDWSEVRELASNNMRNGYLMAIAPTSSISILVGTTQTIEPVYSRKWFEENLSGLIPNVVPNLTLDTYNYYVTAYEIDQLDIVKAAAIRQKWIDQGQSMNIFMDINKASGKYLNDIYTTAWKLGVKSSYYLRSQSPDAEKQTHGDIADRSIECYNCQ